MPSERTSTSSHESRKSSRGQTGRRGNYNSKIANVSTLITEDDDQNQPTIQGQVDKPYTPKPSQTAVDEAIQQIEATMHSIEQRDMSDNALLGPTPTSEVSLDQVPIQALLDTGCSNTIISLNLFL